MTFNAKNLTYDSNEPDFLRKLRTQHGANEPSRHERPIVRPKRQVREGEEEDQPTYVVQGSQDTLSKAEYEAMVGAANDRNHNKKEASYLQPDLGLDKPVKDSRETSEEPATLKQQITSVGGSKKRKFAKVVGGDEDADARRSKDENSAPTRKYQTKKAKKVKLSFVDEVSEP